MKIKVWIFWILVACTWIPLQGQNFDVLDATIARFEEAGNRDSFVFYQNKKAFYAKQADQLGIWAWTQVEIRDFIESNDTAALRVVEQALLQKWRAPATPEEWEPMLYLYAAQGRHLGILGRIWQSTQAFEAARKIFEQFRYEDCDAVEGIYKPLGNHYTRLGDNDRALAIFREALTLTADTESLAGLQYNIGLALWNQGLLAEAQKVLSDALTLPGISRQRQGLLWRGQAVVALQNKSYNEAKNYADAALRLLEPRPTQTAQQLERATTLRTAGTANMHLGNYPKATDLLRDAAVLLHDMPGRELAKTYTALADVALQTRQFTTANEQTNLALSVLIPSFKASQVTDLPPASALYEEITLSEVLFLKAQSAVGLFESSHDLRWLYTAQASHQLAFQTEQRLRAVLYYRSSKLGLQSLSRAREAEAMQVTYLLWEQTKDPKWLQEGCQIAEHSKAALLLENIQDHLIRQQLSTNDPRFEQLHLLQQSLSDLQRQLIVQPSDPQAGEWTQAIATLVQETGDLKGRVLKDYPELRSVWDENSTVPNWSKGLAKDESVLEYLWGAASTEVFFLQKGVVQQWQHIPHDSLFLQTLHTYTQYFSGPQVILNDPAGYQRTAFAAYQYLIPEAARSVPRLCIVPDERLCFFPFESLITESNTASLQNAAYLLRRCEVRYVWSMSVLQRQSDLHYASLPVSMLAVSPVFAQNERGVATLNSAQNEWANMKSCEVETLSGSNARADSFCQKAGRHRLIHLATHASTQPFSKIELSDRSLLLPDLYALHLQADLVVLSACETGTGAYEQGEGVQSIANAFAQSGAACLISSLWSVNDKSTARLFDRFYTYLSEGLSTGSALRSAKLDYLDNPEVSVSYQSPYYWAGMVMIGDNRQLGETGSNTWLWGLGAAGILGLGAAAWRRSRIR